MGREVKDCLVSIFISKSDVPKVISAIVLPVGAD